MNERSKRENYKLLGLIMDALDIGKETETEDFM